MEEIERLEYFFQFIQANAVHRPLQASARASEKYPMGRDAMSSPGLRMKATNSKATVIV